MAQETKYVLLKLPINIHLQTKKGTLDYDYEKTLASLSNYLMKIAFTKDEAVDIMAKSMPQNWEDMPINEKLRLKYIASRMFNELQEKINGNNKQ